MADTFPTGSIDIDSNGQYDALTDGLLLLRGMFGLDGDALVSGTLASVPLTNASPSKPNMPLNSNRPSVRASYCPFESISIDPVGNVSAKNSSNADMPSPS